MALFSILTATSQRNATRQFEWSFAPGHSYAIQLNFKTYA